MLVSQSVKTSGDFDRETLKALYAQKTNRTIIGTGIKPLVALYYGVWGTQSYNQDKYIRKRDYFEKKFEAKIAATTSQKKINNLQFRKQKKMDRMNSFIQNGNLWMQWGEPIAVYDSSLVPITVERLQDFLFSKGYFNNKVDAEIKFNGIRERLVEVDYLLFPGQPYVIDTIFYRVSDSTIMKFLHDTEKDSYIRKGKQYDQDHFTRERERIDLLLRDNGFYDFSRQYIEYGIDSTSSGVDKTVQVQIIINDPAKRGYHKQFRIDSISFVTDASVNKPGLERRTRRYRDIRYSYYEDNYNLKILSQRVFLQPGELYSRSKTLNTQRQLANVDAFKFININFDTTGGKFSANVLSSPMPRYEWSNEAGVNVTQGFPGPFYSLSFRKRNIFNGLENFELNGRFGFEGVASPTNTGGIYKSIEAGINASITFPQFIFPFNERTRFKLARYNPKTRLTTGYSYTDRPEYKRTAISINGTYTWQNNRNRSYSLTPLNVSVIDPWDLSAPFQQLLDNQFAQGNFSLYNSFLNSFVTSMIFGVTWNQNNYGNIEKSSSFARVQLEAGGTIWNFVNPKFISDWGLEYFKYLRLSTDLRRINVINPNTTLAYRFNGGLAYSYADNESLPYEKFFFAGGSNSIRAWRPRRLGPGSLKPEESDDPVVDGLYSYSIEKPAEILLEASIELRKKLFGFVSGAVFIDAGNVWNFRPKGEETSENRGSSYFRVDQFYKEIAVGTGFGLRFDFTFLILRFDVGMKVFDPARDESERFVLNKVRFWKPYATEVGENQYTSFREPVIYNVGIGYSF